MNALALWATVVVLTGSLLYPIFSKIRRRGSTDRHEGLYTISGPEHAAFE